MIRLVLVPAHLQLAAQGLEAASVEALVVAPQWAELFSEDEIEGARRTLKQFGYVAG